MQHLEKILYLLKAIWRVLTDWVVTWFMSLPPYKRVVAVLGGLGIVFVAYKVLPGADKPLVVEDSKPVVKIESLYNLSNKISPLYLSGTVSSVNEAVIRTEGGGRLTKVYKKLGDRVVAGQVLAELENSGERASVLQAEGAYESAKAARDIALINSKSSTLTLEDAKQNTLNSINSAYVTLEDAVRVKADTAFLEADMLTPKLKILIPDSILQSKIENSRGEIQKVLENRYSRNLVLTKNDDLILEIQKVQAEVSKVKLFLDDLNSAYLKAIPNNDFTQASLDAQKSVINVARGSVAGIINSLSVGKTALQNSFAGEEISGRTTTVSDTKVASVDAQLKTAQGSYLSALSRLEKTIIRSPISGTLNSLTIETGDYVTPSQQVAVVANNGALEIICYITSEDAKRISVGTDARINSTSKGVVTRIAEAIDPLTKKIEVKVGILDQAKTFINGTSVRVEFGGSFANNKNTKTDNPNTNDSTNTGINFKIPISALKITPRGNFIYTVSSSSTLDSVQVDIGRLLGEDIEILSPLSSDLLLVTDVRGLKVGEEVVVQQ
jgi:multidrug resistance efflux pump